MNGVSGDAFTLLDVRQPREYHDEHIPGARLIPLGELSDRLSEIDRNIPTIVYCAIGGRSRVAAQMLSGKGFTTVYNLKGGIKAWQDPKAFGSEESGLTLFTGKESITDTLIVAYSLEEGLKAFYLAMIPQVKNETARDLFKKLSDIETKHQERIYQEYANITGGGMSREAFQEKIIEPAMEGGITIEEFIAMYQPDLDVVEEIISLAMAIEAQALDLYQRASDRAEKPENKTALLQIANEERSHLEQLGKLFEQIV